MELEVKIKTIGPLQSGDKKDGSGKWFAKDLVLEVCDGTRYPDEFVVRLTGDNAQSNELKEGQLCKADISFSTREYNGRQYQDSWLRGIEPIETGPSKSPCLGGLPDEQGSETTEDLPF